MGPGIPFALVRPTVARRHTAPIMAANRPRGEHGDARPQIAIAGVPPVVHDARRNGDRSSRSKLAASIAHDAVDDLEPLLLPRMGVRARDGSFRHRQQIAQHTLGRVLDDARVLAADGIVQDRSGGELGTHVRGRDSMDAHAPILAQFAWLTADSGRGSGARSVCRVAALGARHGRRRPPVGSPSAATAPGPCRAAAAVSRCRRGRARPGALPQRHRRAGAACPSAGKTAPSRSGGSPRR